MVVIEFKVGVENLSLLIQLSDKGLEQTMEIGTENYKKFMDSHF